MGISVNRFEADAEGAWGDVRARRIEVANGYDEVAAGEVEVERTVNRHITSYFPCA
jgi:hypothetical protein